MPASVLMRSERMVLASFFWKMRESVVRVASQRWGTMMEV
jgi:hypothetical protein